MLLCSMLFKNYVNVFVPCSFGFLQSVEQFSQFASEVFSAVFLLCTSP